MKLNRNRLFPYPVLTGNPINDGYKNTKFQFVYTVENDDNYLILKNAHYELNNDDLKFLISINKIFVNLVLESSYTVYRRIFDISSEGKDIKIPINLVKDKVYATCYLTANADINGFNNPDFNDEYAHYKYDIKKYEVLGIDSTSFDVDYETNDNLTSNIFSIIPSFKCEDDNVTLFELGEKKITISVSEDIFDKYKTIEGISEFGDYYLSLFCVPALMFALTELKKYSSLDDADYKWLKPIKKRYLELTNKELTSENLFNEEPAILAQKIVGCPISKVVNDLFEQSLTTTIGGAIDE